FFYQKYQTS
ncbi:hypothetical protein ECPA49_2439, partial [Escherichia coli PA49]